jgi:hypothetical protein
MAEAIKYALGHWEELKVFVSDGAVAIDNNVSEREMKRVVLNRKSRPRSISKCNISLWDDVAWASSISS